MQKIVSIRSYLFLSLKYKLFHEKKKQDKYVLQDTGADEIPEFSYEAMLIMEQEDREKKEKLLSLMCHLTPRQQEALYLRYYSEMSYKEISAVMAISEQAVTNLVFKAIRLLRQNFYGILLGQTLIAKALLS